MKMTNVIKMASENNFSLECWAVRLPCNTGSLDNKVYTFFGPVMQYQPS